MNRRAMLTGAALLWMAPKHASAATDRFEAALRALRSPWRNATRSAPFASRCLRRLTVHGIDLEDLTLACGLRHGETLAARGAPDGAPRFDASMSRLDLEDFVMESYKARGLGRVRVSDVRPTLFLGARGVRLHAEMTALDGLTISVLAVAAITDERLDMFGFSAPAEHFFPSLAPEIEHALTAAASI